MKPCGMGVVVWAIVLFAGGARGEDAPVAAPFTWENHPETLIVLGRVKAVNKAEVGDEVEYRVDVVREWRERIRAGQTIIVVGRGTYDQPWRVGQAVLFAADPTDVLDKVEFASVYTDIVVAARRIVEREVPLVVEAMKEMRKLCEGPQDVETLRRKAKEMMSSGNFYVWCVGATVWMGHIRTREDVAVIERVYADERTPLRKIVWLEGWLLQTDWGFPLDRAARHVLLETYLRKRFAELPLLPEEGEEEGRAGAATRPAR